MKLTIPTKQLAAALATLKSIAKPGGGAASTHPILSNVLIEAASGEVTLLAYDLEKQLKIRLQCDVKEPGSTTVSCAKLGDWLSTRPEQSCEISTDEKHKTTARCGKSHTSILGLPPEEFPQLLKVDSADSFKVDAGLFSQSMAHALIHSSDDRSREVLMSVYLCANEGKLAFVGTSGLRLAAISTDSPCKEGLDAIIPKASAQTLVAFATVGELTVTASDNALLVASENQEFATKLIGSRFPSWKQVVPANTGNPVSAAKGAFAVAVNSALSMCGEIKTVELSHDGAELTVTASGGATGQDTAVGSIEAKGKPMKIGVNPQFMRDALKCVSSDDVTLLTTGENSPILIEDGFLKIVIMPMRIK